jgi:hypothetical protein
METRSIILQDDQLVLTGASARKRLFYSKQQRKNRPPGGLFLFLCLLESDVLSKLFAVFLKLYLALHLSLVLAGVVDLAGLFVSKDYELVL